MIKKEVLAAWEKRMSVAQSKIEDELEFNLEKLRYEQEISQRLLAKAQDETEREDWQIQIDVYETMIALAENDLAEQQEELDLCKAMIAEIKSDLKTDA